MLAGSESELQRMMDRLNMVSVNYNMEINTKKTNVLRVSKHGRPQAGARRCNCTPLDFGFQKFFTMQFSRKDSYTGHYKRLQARNTV